MSLSHKLGTLAGGLVCFPFVYGAYPPQAHSRVLSIGIRSLIWVGKLCPLANSVLYLQYYQPEAAPKGISGRTSYLRVWLAFHPYPQIIPQFFNIGGFGPPSRFTETSTCPWVAHPASGLIPATKRPIRTRFRYGFTPEELNLATDINSQAHYSIGTQSL